MPTWMLFLAALFLLLAILWFLGVRFDTQALIDLPRAFGRGWER
jgi:hypothetical protein